MMVVSHVLLGGAAWVAAARLQGAAPADAVALGAAVIGSLLPDLDHPSSWVGRRVWPVSRPLSLLLGHRGLTHSLLAVVAGLVLLHDIGTVGLPARLIEPAVIGYLSHLAADALTPAGVPLLWPWKRRFALPLCSTGGLMETLVVAAGLAANTWLCLMD